MEKDQAPHRSVYGTDQATQTDWITPSLPLVRSDQAVALTVDITQTNLHVLLEALQSEKTVLDKIAQHRRELKNIPVMDRTEFARMVLAWADDECEWCDKRRIEIDALMLTANSLLG